ncbi:MAG TPA: class I SAM-dependent methyltransferase [Polyangiaceae bacterium]|nr:class I SAM-dependent methyltransferase [Polyangiaceae bacterium]
MAHLHSARSLAHYEEVGLYDLAFAQRKNDVEFFVRSAKQLPVGSSILELGAGTGRVTLPLARAGYQVCAVDLAEPMLGRLKARLGRAPKVIRERVRVKRGDVRKLALKQQFPLILATFNVVGHLETFLDFAAFLRTAKQHLTKDGRLLFDVPIPHPDEIEGDPELRHPAPRFKHPVTRQWVRQTERFEYDATRQVLLVESEYRVAGMPDPLVVPLSLRQWFPKEVEALLYYEGFSRVESFADYSDQPGLLAQDTLVFSAQK